MYGAALTYLYWVMMKHAFVQDVMQNIKFMREQAKAKIDVDKWVEAY